MDNFAAIDWVILGGWMLFTLGVGFWFSRRASESTESFFVSGRSLSWWVVGTSMVATTFAADTPLAVSGFMAKGGIVDNWMWWTLGLSGMASVFLFAKLWRRSGVLTDAELVELRYGGEEAAWLRGIKAVWFGVIQNCLILAWVMAAMAKITTVVLGLDDGDVLFTVALGSEELALKSNVAVMLGLFLIATIYTSASGMWGVVTTDVVQFVMAITIAVVFGVISWNAVGGLAGLESGFVEHGLDWEATTRMVPELTTRKGGEFLLYVGVIWWSQYTIDGGGYLAQRLFAAKDERHAAFGYLWFTVAHICLRPWPWIVVGLCGLAMYGAAGEGRVVEDPEKYYPVLMTELLGPGLFGLMVASFLAAFMSTIDTHLNWGASLVVNDVYKRFVKRDADERQLLRVSRVTIVALAFLGALASLEVDSIKWAWTLAFSVTSGVGTVYIARWYWWRPNAWSEISAMAFAAAMTALFWAIETDYQARGADVPWWTVYPGSAAITAVGSIACWISVTLFTRPVAREHLERFYDKVRPGGAGWRAIAGGRADFESDGPGAGAFVGIVGGCLACYGALFSVGYFLLGRTGAGAIALAAFAVGALVLSKKLRPASFLK